MSSNITINTIAWIIVRINQIGVVADFWLFVNTFFEYLHYIQKIVTGSFLIPVTILLFLSLITLRKCGGYDDYKSI